MNFRKAGSGPACSLYAGAQPRRGAPHTVGEQMTLVLFEPKSALRGCPHLQSSLSGPHRAATCHEEAHGRCEGRSRALRVFSQGNTSRCLVASSQAQGARLPIPLSGPPSVSSFFMGSNWEPAQRSRSRAQSPKGLWTIARLCVCVWVSEPSARRSREGEPKVSSAVTVPRVDLPQKPLAQGLSPRKCSALLSHCCCHCPTCDWVTGHRGPLLPLVMNPPFPAGRCPWGRGGVPVGGSQRGCSDYVDLWEVTRPSGRNHAPLFRRRPHGSLVPSPCEDAGKSRSHEPERGPHPELRPPASRTASKEFLLSVSPSVGGVFVAEAQTEPHSPFPVTL